MNVTNTNTFGTGNTSFITFIAGARDVIWYTNSNLDDGVYLITITGVIKAI
jgi:hypothetical protein